MIFRLLRALAAVSLAATGAAQGEHRPLSPHSSMVRSIHAQAVPGDPDGVRVLAAVLHHAHDPGAPYLARHAVQQVLVHRGAPGLLAGFLGLLALGKAVELLAGFAITFGAVAAGFEAWRGRRRQAA